MKIEARWQKDLHFTCLSPSQHTIDLDSGPNGATRGPGPMEVLLEAVACCSGMDVVSILKKKKKALNDFTITATGMRQDTHPKKFTHIRLLYSLRGRDLSKEDVDHAIRLSVDKYCPVIGMLKSCVDITWECEILR